MKFLFILAERNFSFYRKTEDNYNHVCWERGGGLEKYFRDRRGFPGILFSSDFSTNWIVHV